MYFDYLEAGEYYVVVMGEFDTGNDVQEYTLNVYGHRGEENVVEARNNSELNALYEMYIEAYAEYP
jgi:hypothetical protein